MASATRTTQTLRPISRLQHRAVFERNLLLLDGDDGAPAWRRHHARQLRAGWPRCGARDIDLYFLYQMVLAFGGHAKFHAAGRWGLYLQAHGINTSAADARAVPSSFLSSSSSLPSRAPASSSVPALASTLDKVYRLYLLPLERWCRQRERARKNEASVVARSAKLQPADGPSVAVGATALESLRADNNASAKLKLKRKTKKQ